MEISTSRESPFVVNFFAQAAAGVPVKKSVRRFLENRGHVRRDGVGPRVSVIAGVVSHQMAEIGQPGGVGRLREKVSAAILSASGTASCGVVRVDLGVQRQVGQCEVKLAPVEGAFDGELGGLELVQNSRREFFSMGRDNPRRSCPAPFCPRPNFPAFARGPRRNPPARWCRKSGRIWRGSKSRAWRGRIRGKASPHPRVQSRDGCRCGAGKLQISATVGRWYFPSSSSLPSMMPNWRSDCICPRAGTYPDRTGPSARPWRHRTRRKAAGQPPICKAASSRSNLRPKIL